MSTNANIRRRISSCNDLGESLLHAHSDAHVLPAVQDTLDRRRKSGLQKPYIPKGIIDPQADWYCIWWGVTIAGAGFTGVYEPWVVAFLPHSERYSWASPTGIIFVLLHVLYSVDILISFRVAFTDTEVLVTNKADVARNYRRTRFYWDLVAWLPFDYIALAVLGDFKAGQSVIARVPLLRLLRMVRLYRVRWFFEHLEFNLTMSLLWVTLIRNLIYVFYVTHWSACMFYFIAVQYGLDHDTWIGRHFDDVVDLPLQVRYVYSLYWAITTLATVGYGDFSAVNTAEAVWATIYMFFNLALGAYVLGTITLLVVKHDERTGRYRHDLFLTEKMLYTPQTGIFWDLSTNLKEYINVNEIPDDLKDSMHSHLRLHFNNEEASDEQVLHIFPTTIRRRILRHLYLRHVRAAYLFKGVRQKFLDALLATARIELFMPQVEILSEGDNVNELMLLVGGMVEVLRPGAEDVEELTIDVDGHSSIRGGSYNRSLYGAGDSFGEVAFYTEVAQLETVRSISVCRILVVPRAAYNSIAAAFPIGARTVLTNLLTRSHENVQEQFRGRGGAHAYNTIMLHSAPTIPSKLKFKWAAPELVEGALVDEAPGPGGRTAPALALQSAASGSSCGRSPRDLQSAAAGNEEQEQERLVPTTPFAAAASAEASGSSNPSGTGSSSGSGKSSERRGRRSGELPGRPPRAHTSSPGPTSNSNSHSHGGPMPQSASAIPGLTHRQEMAMANLLRVRAMVQQTLARQDAERTNQFLYAASQGDVAKIRQMLHQGFAPDSADYDGRTALMLASVKGHADVAVALISAGADVAIKDNLNRNGLMEACIHGHTAIIELLRRQGATLGQEPVAMASHLCTCVFEGDLPLLRRLIAAGAPADVGDYDKRTALHIAAAEGNTAAIRLLVEEGGADVHVKDRWGNTPLDEARRVGARPCAAYLEQRLNRHAHALTPLEESGKR
ncbi:probable potassium channel AKT2 [Coccomyxa sp. Obi]|nr:probable potassium channel AKT2 [Coccomyxa sp. Obi]